MIKNNSELLIEIRIEIIESSIAMLKVIDENDCETYKSWCSGQVRCYEDEMKFLKSLLY